MPGFPPPPAGPPPLPAAAASLSASVQPPALPSINVGGVSFGAGLPDSPGALSLCGFTFPPPIFFQFGFQLPTINFPPPLPSIFLALSINCSLTNPLNLSGGLKYGGGRDSNAPPDPDQLEQA